jgi:hypothetical protein
LLGIIGRKIYMPAKSASSGSEDRHLAKYFVPASTIRGFIRTERCHPSKPAVRSASVVVPKVELAVSQNGILMQH